MAKLIIYLSALVLVYVTDAVPVNLLEDFGPGKLTDTEGDQAGIFRMVIGGPDGSEERLVTYKKGGAPAPPRYPAPTRKPYVAKPKPARYGTGGSSKEGSGAVVAYPVSLTYSQTKDIKPIAASDNKDSSSGESSPRRSYGKSYAEKYDQYEPAKYNFAYKVVAKGPEDSDSQEYGHSEARDGDRTDGRYYVELPDGRLQTVEYYVDGASGFVAKVTYSDGPAKPSSYSSKKSYAVAAGAAPSAGKDDSSAEQ